ncbi:hypothetical protein CC80DRAFT_443419 [Byssothecium circinans]|uniref:Thioesterase/thiol ester dehydrase-isomerase n=1 Tax=Byssothecium circinans TaxID=147558 RepID=A0A6A5U837_9PLEO|nr:hypothetical protein CC80DRAFT_443419 [Byssothecium circinans]
MALSTPCLARAARTPIHRTQWRRSPSLRRLYSAGDGSGTEWFQTLRDEMLSRRLPVIREATSKEPEIKLAHTLSSFLPPEWEAVFTTQSGKGAPAGYTGNHLIYFNPALPPKELLPDGTDPLHSPGYPFVRRMWAGGSVRINLELYFRDDLYSWAMGKSLICVERIKEVQMRGQGEGAKIFVTLERRIGSIKRILASWAASNAGTSKAPGQVFEEQARQGDRWGDAMLIEERNLVFMREKERAELQALKAGETKPTRYLAAPGHPDFSHTLTPTSSLLFRFSALTFNAHAIHLDREYCRTVEGHRNLLVHGPMTLMLMVKLIASHLATNQSGSPKTVHAIEYRNIAPLYCDEPLRLCAREKKGLATNNGSVFDVWIEGPTGGVAVKGTVTTTIRDRQLEPLPATHERTTTIRKVLAGSSVRETQHIQEPVKVRMVNSQPTESNVRPTDFRVPDRIKKKRSISQKVNVSHTIKRVSDAPGKTLLAHDGPIPTAGISIPPRLIAQTSDPITPIPSQTPPSQHQKTTDEQPASTLRRIRLLRATPGLMRPTMSPKNRQLLKVRTRMPTYILSVKPIPIIRKHHAAIPEEKQPDSVFEKRGGRKILENRLSIREAGQGLDRMRRRQMGEGRMRWVQWSDGTRIRRL